MREQAQERLERALQNVTSTTVAGLIVPTHMTEIMDIIYGIAPVVELRPGRCRSTVAR